MSSERHHLILLAHPETYTHRDKCYPCYPDNEFYTLTGHGQIQKAGAALSKNFAHIGEILVDDSSIGIVTGRSLEYNIKPNYPHLRSVVPASILRDDPWAHFRVCPALNDLALPSIYQGKKRNLEGDKVVACLWRQEKAENRVSKVIDMMDQIKTPHNMLVIASAPILRTMATLLENGRMWDEYVLNHRIKNRSLELSGLVDYLAIYNEESQRYDYQLRMWHCGAYG